MRISNYRICSLTKQTQIEIAVLDQIYHFSIKAENCLKNSGKLKRLKAILDPVASPLTS